MNIGFAIVGRPIGMEVAGNGLYSSPELGEYLYLQGVVDSLILDRNERIAVVRYIKYQSKTILSITIYLHAAGYGQENRPGGFLGVSVAIGAPVHITKICSALSLLERKAKKLVDPDTRKFLKASSDEWHQILHPPNEKDYLSNSNSSSSPFNNMSGRGNSQIVFTTSEPIYLPLVHILDGFIRNQEYRRYGCCIVVTKKSINDKLIASGLISKPAYSLMDYSAQQKARLDEIRSVEHKLAAVKAEDIRYNELLSTLSRQVQQKQEELQRLESDVNRQKNALRGLEIEIRDSKRMADGHRESQRALLSKNREHLENELLHGKFRELFWEHVRKQVNLKQRKFNEELQPESVKLEVGKRQSGENRKYRLLIKILAALMISVTSILLYHSFFFPTIQDRPLDIEQSYGVPTQDSEIDVPRELTLNQYLSLGSQDRHLHSTQIKEYLSAVKTGFATLSQTEKDAFKERKWQFVDFVSKSDIEGERDIVNHDFFIAIDDFESLVRDTFKVKKFTASSRTGFDEFPGFSPFLSDLLNPKNCEVVKQSFETSSRAKILCEYLNLDKSIYIQLDENIKGCSAEEYSQLSEAQRIILLHLRWMIFHLNEEVDLKTSEQKEFSIAKRLRP